MAQLLAQSSILRDAQLSAVCANGDSPACQIVKAEAKVNGNDVWTSPDGRIYTFASGDSRVLSLDPSARATLLDAQLGSPVGAILSGAVLFGGGSVEQAILAANLGQSLEGLGAGLSLFGARAPLGSGTLGGASSSKISGNSSPGIRSPETVGNYTGTVWDLIKPTQANYPGSVLPKSFEMTLSNGSSVWVHGNATEHLAEYVQMVARNNPPTVVQMATQQQLANLQGAVSEATRGGTLQSAYQC